MKLRLWTEKELAAAWLESSHIDIFKKGNFRVTLLRVSSRSTEKVGVLVGGTSAGVGESFF